MGQLAPASVSTLYQLHNRDIFRDKICFILIPHREVQCVPRTVCQGMKERRASQKEGRGREEGKYLNEDTEAEFSSKMWNKILALQMMDKKRRSL